MADAKPESTSWHLVPPELVGADALPTALYINLDGRYTFYYSPESVAWEDARARLASKDIPMFWVPDNQFAAFQEHVVRRIRKIAQDQRIPPRERGRLVYHACYQALQESYSNPNDHTAFVQAKLTAGETIKAVMEHPEILPGVGLLIGHHYDTFAHSVQVAALTVRLAQRMAIETPDGLHRIGLGAMFHDIGKVRVPQGLLNKAGPLTGAEWQVMQEYPTWGASVLERFQDGEIAWEPALQHHERYNGGGYPNKLHGNEIALSARITKVADVFHALTSRRAYRKALNPYGALALMRTQMHQHFDPEVLTEFIFLLASVGESVDEDAPAA